LEKRRIPAENIEDPAQLRGLPALASAVRSGDLLGVAHGMTNAEIVAELKMPAIALLDH